MSERSLKKVDLFLSLKNNALKFKKKSVKTINQIMRCFTEGKNIFNHNTSAHNIIILL